MCQSAPLYRATNGADLDTARLIMTCYHPLKRWVIGTKINEKGQEIEKAIITSYNTMNIESESFNFKYYKEHGKEYIDENFEIIPCGKCIGCRLEYSKQWAMRCMMEANQWQNNYFLTLTYDEENVPHAKGVKDFETGEIGEVLTLKKEDLQKFMKRLRIEYQRKLNWKNIRFYGVGEYGTTTERPHYHIIAFNLPINDLKFWYIDKKGSKIFRSEFLEKIWGKGIVAIADCTWETCAYVARYMMKKIKGKEAVELFEDTGRIQEFSLMSRDPGIAKNWYLKNKDTIYKTDEIFLPNKKGMQKIKPPRYFDNMYDIEEPELMEAIKQKRKDNAETKEKTRIQIEKIDKLSSLERLEKLKIQQIERLKRQKI